MQRDAAEIRMHNRASLAQNRSRGETHKCGTCKRLGEDEASHQSDKNGELAELCQKIVTEVTVGCDLPTHVIGNPSSHNLGAKGSRESAAKFKDEGVFTAT